MRNLSDAIARLRAARTEATTPGERGDVPGWVLVTLMTAGLVTAIWAVASPTLVNLFETAVQGVSGP